MNPEYPAATNNKNSLSIFDLRVKVKKGGTKWPDDANGPRGRTIMLLPATLSPFDI